MRYNVQCINGHVAIVPEGDALEQRCEAHRKKGYLDALILHPSECEMCREEIAQAEDFVLPEGE